jgi:hypothetical protein
MGGQIQLDGAIEGVIQSCFDETCRTLYELNLEPTYSTEMADWAALVTDAPKRGIVNPSFDPAHSDLSVENAFWIRLDDTREGRTVACIANRLFVTDDFMALWRTQRLWYSHGPRSLIDLAIPDDMPILSGRVGHHGGLWIHPDWRKHGLSGYMTRLARCASLRRFDVDWHAGLVFAAIAEKGLPITPTTGYGYPRMVLAVDGWVPLTDRPERLYVPWISRSEILAQLADETRRLIADRDQQPVGLPVAS